MYTTMKEYQPHDRDSDLAGVSTEFIGSLRSLIESERDASMMSMPTERVVRAVRRSTGRSWSNGDSLAVELLGWFRPVFVAGMLLIVAMAAYNFQMSRGYHFELSTTEMVLGLHPVTVAAAYDPTIEDH